MKQTELGITCDRYDQEFELMDKVVEECKGLFGNPKAVLSEVHARIWEAVAELERFRKRTDE